jgi:predicted dehydrogenase
MSDLRVLLVGAGRAGMVHGRSFASGIQGAKLVSIADPDREARERAAAELGCELTFDDPLVAATDEDVDAVIVASPTFTHAEIVLAALEAGKHVLCEKPLASTLEEAEKVRSAVDASPSSMVMGFMRRFDTRFVRAWDRIQSGDIGDPVFVRSTGRGPGLPPEWAWDPRRSGGLVAEVNSHDLDSVRWFSGKELETVHAVGLAAKRPDIAHRFPGFVDVLAAVFQLSGGGLAQIDGACPAGYGYDARVEIYGTEGLILVGDPRADSALLVRAEGAVTDPVASWRDLFADAYRAEDVHLARVARGEEAPRATAIDGLRALEAAVAVNRSIESASTVRMADLRSG